MTPTWGLWVSWKMVKSTPPISQSKHVVKLEPMLRNCCARTQISQSHPYTQCSLLLLSHLG